MSTAGWLSLIEINTALPQGSSLGLSDGECIPVAARKEHLVIFLHRVHQYAVVGTVQACGEDMVSGQRLLNGGKGPVYEASLFVEVSGESDQYTWPGENFRYVYLRMHIPRRGCLQNCNPVP